MTAILKTLRIKIIDALLRLQDHLIFIDRVSVVEVLMFCVLTGWAIWFSIFDVKNASPSFSLIVDGKLWLIIITLIITTHAVSAFARLPGLRVLVCYSYSMFWAIWLITVTYTRLESPFVPTIFSLLIASVILCVKVRDEYHRIKIVRQHS